MIYKEQKLGTYNIYTIKTNKFKTCHMEIIFRNNIIKEDVTKRSLLVELLIENNKKYNTRKKMSRKLEDLYNSYYYGVTNRVGSSIITSFCFDFINPELVNEDIEEFIKFPINSILNPNLENNEFDIKTFNYTKERVKKDIEGLIENPKNYTINKLLSNMCPNTPSSINISGNIEDLNDITNINIYEYYKFMLEHDYIDIYIIGNLDMNKVVKIIEKNTRFNILKDHKISYEINNTETKKVKKIYNNFNISQENICFGLNINNCTEFEQNYISQVYNTILGGGSLETKLYNNLRNKNSLCYNCVSIYQKYDNLILIHTAIDKKDEMKAIKLIKQSLEEFIKGKITNKELENAKKIIITNLNMSLDNPGRIVDNYVFKNLYNLDDIETRIKNYNKVTKKDLINFSKKVKINTILCVKEDKNEKN